MSVLKCKMCGGSLAVEAGRSVAVCEYCGTRQTLPRLEDERIAGLYERAELLRRSNDFDKAASVYEQIVTAAPKDAEAYWSLVLCRYGIEYVEDPTSHKRVPTINRIQYGSVLDDGDYRSALQFADLEQKAVYEAEARAIEAIQKGFLAISMKEKPFDVFICYKESDSSGRRTPDSVLANDLYHQLTQEGFKVFFSRITLEDKLGAEYEPYIFAALNSAQVMVTIGTKAEYFTAPWVRNEWSRFLALIKNGEQKTLIPAYRDMNPYDLPEEFSHLQALDMSRLGFMQDLIRGIKKILGTAPVAPAASISDHGSQYIKRAYFALEDGEWKKANQFCEQALNEDAENPLAYLGKLMARLHVRKLDELGQLKTPFDAQPLYEKALRFADRDLSARLKGYNETIRNREKEKEQEKLAIDAKKAEEANEKKAKFAAAVKKNGKKVLAAVLAIALLIGCVYGVGYIKDVQAEKAQLAAAEEAARLEEERLAAEAAEQAEAEEESAVLQKEELWEKFRTAMDGEPADHTAATAALEELSALDAPRADEGWHELTKVFYKRGLPTEAAEYLAKISDSAAFEDIEKLTENIRLLDLYVQAKEIKVTSEETKTALQDLLDQLPEDYRKVADLRKQIEDFEKQKDAEPEETAQKPGKTEASAGNQNAIKSSDPMALTAQNLAGMWWGHGIYSPYSQLDYITFRADGSFVCGKNLKSPKATGTYAIEGDTILINVTSGTFKWPAKLKVEKATQGRITFTNANWLERIYAEVKPENAVPEEDRVYDAYGEYDVNEYDEKGRKYKVTHYTKDDMVSGSYIYEFNDAGQVIKQIFYGPTGTVENTISYVYDARGNRIEERRGSDVTYYDYDENNVHIRTRRSDYYEELGADGIWYVYNLKGGRKEFCVYADHPYYRYTYPDGTVEFEKSNYSDTWVITEEQMPSGWQNWDWEYVIYKES